MARITNKDIHDLFIKYFEGDVPFTESEKKMNGIKITQLRKNVKSYIENNDIDTNLTVNEIIVDVIEYSNLIGMKFRSTASLGYDVLPKSINYWKKRRKLLEEQEASSSSPDQDSDHNYVVNQNKHNDINEVIKKSYKEKQPKWMKNNEW